MDDGLRFANGACFITVGRLKSGPVGIKSGLVSHCLPIAETMLNAIFNYCYCPLSCLNCASSPSECSILD